MQSSQIHQNGEYVPGRYVNLDGRGRTKGRLPDSVRRLPGVVGLGSQGWTVHKICNDRNRGGVTASVSCRRTHTSTPSPGPQGWEVGVHRRPRARRFRSILSRVRRANVV